jgi:hypothetical protein
VPLAHRGLVFFSQLFDGFKSMDQSRAKVRCLNAFLIADHLVAIGEIEVIARWRKKRPGFLC